MKRGRRTEIRNAVVAGVLFLFVALVAWWGYSSPDPGRKLGCIKEDNLRVRLGNAELSIPREYEPSLTADREYLSERDICQSSDEPPVNAGSLFIDLNDDHPHTDLQPTRRTRMIWNVQIRIGVKNSDYQGPVGAFDSALQVIEMQGADPEHLPVKHDFMVLDTDTLGPHIGAHVYIAKPGTVERRDPVPFVIRCSALKYISPTPTRSIYAGRSCSTPSYSVTDELNVSYRFYDGLYGVEDFAPLDTAVREFVRGLVVPANAEAHPAGTGASR